MLFIQDEEVKQVFNPAPFVSFRSAKNLRSYPVRAKVYPVRDRLVGSRKCNKNRCQVYKNVIETETFQSFVEKKVYKINQRFTCSDRCLVYLLSCKLCGTQYDNQTNNGFRYRWGNYTDNNRKSLRGEDHKQPGFFAHFQTAGHSDFINDTEIRFIDKTDPSDPTRREDFWIDTLKTRYLQSLNNIDLYHQLFIVFAVLLVSTVFTENVYFCSFRIFFFSYRFYYLRVTFICYISFG